MSERDTHFKGVAKLLWKDIWESIPDSVTESIVNANIWEFGLDGLIEQGIARRLYDLALHVVRHAPCDSIYAYDDIVNVDIPDLTEWDVPEGDEHE